MQVLLHPLQKTARNAVEAGTHICNLRFIRKASGMLPDDVMLRLLHSTAENAVGLR